MSRTPTTLREAEARDLPALQELWADILRTGTAAEQIADIADLLAQCEQSNDKSIVVAEYDGRIAGGVYLCVSTLTPLNLEPTVLAVSPHVLPDFRRRGVGTALMEAAVRFAELRGVANFTTAANTESRESNRFMARLALAPQATLRSAATATIRSRLTSRAPRARSVTTHRHIDKVLAARRSRREHVAS